jgi:hypothetical protein
MNFYPDRVYREFVPEDDGILGEFEPIILNAEEYPDINGNFEPEGEAQGEPEGEPKIEPVVEGDGELPDEIDIFGTDTVKNFKQKFNSNSQYI